MFLQATDFTAFRESSANRPLFQCTGYSQRFSGSTLGRSREESLLLTYHAFLVAIRIVCGLSQSAQDLQVISAYSPVSEAF